MPYKKKEKKSLLLYYDYIEQFELLDDKQLRKLIYAMIDFDKDGKEVRLDKMTTMAFVPIKRRLIEDKKKWEETCKKNSENIKKRWAKEKDTTVYECIREDTKNTDIDKEKDKDIEKDIDKESENNNITAPTLDSVISFGESLGVNEKYCKKFFNNYESVGWKIGKNKIKNWKTKLEQWVNDDIEKGNIKTVQSERRSL